MLYTIAIMFALAVSLFKPFQYKLNMFYKFTVGLTNQIIKSATFMW